MSRLLIFAGAGASVDSGILPFRQEEGRTIWGNEDIERICSFGAWRLAHGHNDVNAIMHIHNFHKSMQQMIKAAEPNRFHKYVAELAATDGYDVTVVTTNVDDFFERAGVPGSKIVHLHGSTLRRRCPSCQYRYEDHTSMWQSPQQIERCPREKCRSRLVKTDVIFYGEQCPDYIAGIQAFNRLKAGDIAIMVGSSGQTFDVAQRLWARCRSRRVHTIHINPSVEPHHLFPADLSLLDSVSHVLPDLELHMRIHKSVEHVLE